MELIIYPKLSTRSRRAMTRTKKKWGHPYHYRPREELISRLQEELKMTRNQVLDQIREERAFLLDQNLI